MIRLRVDGADVEVADEGATLLTVLREQAGIRSAKDGCSPQGQCGCCTVWVDGAPRVACVTPVRRLAGREVTTLNGLPEATRRRWSEALVATGGSQCGFCTPGILMRLAALEGTAGAADRIGQYLVAHLCRCTGWQTIVEAARSVLAGDVAQAPARRPRPLDVASVRAGIEGRTPQRVGPSVALGEAGFADDVSPPESLVAVVDDRGDYVVAASLEQARAGAAKVQGRSTSLPLTYPVVLPEGDWAVSLQTTWVEPAYVEPDASWCEPGGEPASPCANGGAFGGKVRSPAADHARRLAAEHGRPVRVVWSREDVVRWGPKRPPVAGGIDLTGAGRLRVAAPADGYDHAAWEEVVDRVESVAPGLAVEAVPTPGPPLSLGLRAAVWAEAAALAAAARCVAEHGPGAHRDVPVEVVAPEGGRAVAWCRGDDALEVAVSAGEVLDEVVLRSYCIGAAHQGFSWERSEGIAVDTGGVVRDLTVRSFGIVQARAMPLVSVRIDADQAGPAVNGSDAVLAAVAAARWIADGLPPAWPVHRQAAGRR